MTSCEANRLISTTVTGKQTQLPIDSVFVDVKAGKKGDYTKNNASGYTDPNGKFETYMMIGRTFGCYDIFIEYNKAGYVNKSELNNTEGTVELEKQTVQ